MTEAALAQRVVAHLTAQGWTCHEEVGGWGGPRCDIVAVRDGVVWAIEVKVKLGFEVMSQAWAWRFASHMTSIAVPVSRSDRYFAYEVCRRFGLGCFEVWDSHVSEPVKPMLRESVSKGLTSLLVPEQIGQGVAGSNRGGFSTPFSRTCQALTHAVTREPGLSVRNYVDRIETHYATRGSARSALATLLRRERDRIAALDGIRIDAAGKLWPADAAKGAA